ncbi:helix-turn-helix domain-containing protein [Sodaliphilus sp.]|uniref:helix-turn-helix domain-containing protein n=1 Tax=Sodaliphilus sp. TaxID=2815818 RepID=UPI00388EF6A3
MNAEEPKVNPEGRYSVVETCKFLGIHRTTLWRYTAYGRIKCGVRRSTAKKFYTGSEILRLWKATM